MKLLAFFLVAFSLPISPLLAKTYTVTAAGDHWLVAPSIFNIHLQPWDAQPKPNCIDLFSTLQKNAATIERCLPGASQPQTACKLLKTVLPNAIFGTDDPSSGVAEDVEQYFVVNQSDFDAIPELTSISQAENIPMAKLVLATQSPWPSVTLKQQKVKIFGGAESFLPKLSQLDYLKDLIGQITIGTDGSFGVRDRVSYCELEGGKSLLQGQGSYKAQVKVALSAPALDWTYNLYQRLSALSYPLSGTLEQQALTIGYEIGQHSIENPLTEGDSIGVADLYRAFFEKNKTVLQLKNLTKTQMQQTFSKTLEAEISASFQSHN